MRYANELPSQILGAAIIFMMIAHVIGDLMIWHSSTIKWERIGSKICSFGHAIAWIGLIIFILFA